MKEARSRRVARLLAPVVMVPIGVLVTVATSHAVSFDSAIRWHARSDAAVAALANVLAGVRLFANPASAAAREASALRASRPDDAALLDRIAMQPAATWIGGWMRDVRADISRITASAAEAGAVPVLVAYNIPNRDCGGHSAGGERDARGYGRWIREFSAGLAGRDAVVVLEPDALVHVGCLSPEDRESRLAMLSDAVAVLKRGGAHVYLDAGNARTMKADAIAELLTRAALEQADGFALNVANFLPTMESVRYGEQVSALVGGKHFIIDTSRNGAGGSGDWCNPRGQALGSLPTTRTSNALVDAFLWIKQPGESDGTCNGGPKAGRWWTDYALELARNQPALLAGGAGHPTTTR